MSEILTEAQVAALRKKFYIGHHGSEGALCDSHESLRGYFDALLQGAAAQRVATLMDEADRLKEAFPADSVWDQHAVQCGNCEVWLITKNSPLKANGFPSNGLSDTGESEDEALCGMCAGAEMYRLMDETDKARVEIERLTARLADADKVWAENQRRTAVIAELEKERAELHKDVTQTAAIGINWMQKAQELEKERDAAIAERESAHKVRESTEAWLTRRENGLDKVAGEKAILSVALEQSRQDISRLRAERDGLRRAIAPFADKASFFPAVHPSSLVSICIAKRHLMAADAALTAVPAPVVKESLPTELRRTLIAALEWIDAVPAGTALPAMPGFDRDWVDGLIAAVPAPVAQQGKSHAHQWLKNGDYREDSMFGISCPVWACGSCKITCSATDKPSENL